MRADLEEAVRFKKLLDWMGSSDAVVVDELIQECVRHRNDEAWYLSRIRELTEQVQSLERPRPVSQR